MLFCSCFLFALLFIISLQSVHFWVVVVGAESITRMDVFVFVGLAGVLSFRPFGKQSACCKSQECRKGKTLLLCLRV
jgi:uncharacterized membrane protein YuzA (DUF378 family)